jgi:hypothetical protein
MGTITVGSLILSGTILSGNQSNPTINSKDRFRFTDNVPELDIDLSKGKSDTFIEELVENGGTCEFDQDSMGIKLMSNGITGKCVYQTKQYLYPKSVSSIVCFISANMNPSNNTDVSGSTRVGFFDSHHEKVNDSTGCGIFLECVGDQFFIVKRTYTSTQTQIDERIAMASWNTDVFDGTSSTDNPSKEQLLSSDNIVLIVDVDGMKGMRVGFLMSNHIFYAHIFENTILPTNKLPLRAEIDQAVSGVSLVVRALSVIEEGSSLERGVLHTIDSNTATLLIDSQDVPFCSVRLSTGSERESLRITKLNTVVSTDDIVFWNVLLNATLNSPSWVKEGDLEFDQSSTSLTGGTIVRSGFIRKREIVEIHTEKNKLIVPPLTSSISGVSDIYSIQFKRVDNITSSVSVSLDVMALS